ncbi:MAG: hypothetical protein WD929_07955 [Steroidobacteraceae bacterium]
MSSNEVFLIAILHEPLGQRILRYASMDDVAIWSVLAIILLDWGRVGWQALYLAAFVVASVAFRWLMQRLPANDRLYVGLIWLAACSFGADWAGLHFMVGAFLSGALLVASVAGKLLGTKLAGRILRREPGEGALVGWLLQTKALIMIVFANVLLDKGIITATTFTALLLMAVGSTMLTVPMVSPMLRRLQGIVGRSS